MKFLIPLFLFCCSIEAISQSSGKIIFEEKMDLHVTLPPEREHMKDMIPKYNTAFFELLYNGDESMYARQKDAEQAEITSNQGGNQMVMRFGRDNRAVYKNLATESMIDSREFMQKQFLIKGPPTPRKWKIGKNHKEILGYNCMEATFQQDTATHITAWFTPQIAISNGPSDFQGLPGMILQIDMNHGQRVSTATEIKLDSVDTSTIIPPTKGKEVTSEEFETIRDEKMKEMQLQNGGSGNQMIIRRN